MLKTLQFLFVQTPRCETGCSFSYNNVIKTKFVRFCLEADAECKVEYGCLQYVTWGKNWVLRYLFLTLKSYKVNYFNKSKSSQFVGINHVVNSSLVWPLYDLIDSVL